MQFSLRTLVLLSTILALVITVGLLYANLHTARADLRDFREKNGYVNLDDETLIHVVRAPGDELGEWTYRVHLPDGNKYFVVCEFYPGSMDPFAVDRGRSNLRNYSMVAAKRMVMELKPGQGVLKLRRKVDGLGEKYLHLDFDEADFAAGGAMGKDEWLLLSDNEWQDLAAQTAVHGVGAQQTWAVNGGPLLLLEVVPVRLLTLGKSSSGTRVAYPGAMRLWIDTVAPEPLTGGEKVESQQ